MKSLLMDIMIAMMPFMKPVFMVGLVVAGAGLVLRIAKLLLGLNASGPYGVGLLWAGRIAGILGIFFLVCEPMGAWLGASPSLKFGNPATFEFWLELSFWQIGAMLLIAAIIIGHGVPREQTA